MQIKKKEEKMTKFKLLVVEHYQPEALVGSGLWFGRIREIFPNLIDRDTDMVVGIIIG